MAFGADQRDECTSRNRLWSGGQSLGATAAFIGSLFFEALQVFDADGISPENTFEKREKGIFEDICGTNLKFLLESCRQF